MTTGGFSGPELALLEVKAGAELLAGLAHRFDAPEDAGLAEAGLPFVGHALACAVVDAALLELEPLARGLAGQASHRHRRQRMISSDPIAGELDTGRLASAIPELDLWPIVRLAPCYDTPENAALVAVMGAASRWCSRQATTYADWIGTDLFARNALRSGSMRRLLLQAFGDLPLESIGAAQLLPLAFERLALRQAPPSLYGRALELTELILTLVDPRRLPARTTDPAWVVAATLAGINEAGLQHTAFELWVASLLIGHCRGLGYEIAYPNGRGKPLGVCTSAEDQIEVWWQSGKPIVDWPSPQDHEIRRADETWRALSLMPDLVVTKRSSVEQSILAIECKNKTLGAANSKDVAQALGYLAHFTALPRCALVYRDGLQARAEYRRKSTSQELTALRAPVSANTTAGETLFDLLSA
jgi:hypothetical protein